MRYFDQLKALWSEFFSFKRYKHMNKAGRFFVGLFLLPFLIGFLLEALALFIDIVFLTLVTTPLTFVHELVHKEGQEVKHATQVFIYLISWPAIFVCYVMVAVYTFSIYLNYFWMMFLGYIFSLGGYKFHITPNDGDYTLKANTPMKKPAVSWFLVINFVGLFFAFIGLIVFAAGFGAGPAVMAVGGVLLALGLGLMALDAPFVLLFLRSKEPVEEAKPVEAK